MFDGLSVEKEMLLASLSWSLEPKTHVMQIQNFVIMIKIKSEVGHGCLFRIQFEGQQWNEGLVVTQRRQIDSKILGNL